MWLIRFVWSLLRMAQERHAILFTTPLNLDPRVSGVGRCHTLGTKLHRFAVVISIVTVLYAILLSEITVFIWKSDGK